jgi:hypothetical protein
MSNPKPVQNAALKAAQFRRSDPVVESDPLHNQPVNLKVTESQFAILANLPDRQAWIRAAIAEKITQRQEPHPYNPES